MEKTFHFRMKKFFIKCEKIFLISGEIYAVILGRESAEGGRSLFDLNLLRLIIEYRNAFMQIFVQKMFQAYYLSN